MNYQIFQFLHSFANQHWSLNWLFVFFAQYLAYILVVVFVFLIFWSYRNWKERFNLVYFSVLSLLISNGLVVGIIRFFYYNPRPFKLLEFEPLISYIDSSSIPSGHTSAFFAFAVLVFFTNRKYFWYFLIGAIIMGIARIIVGVHWPADILIGIAVGVSSVLIARYLIDDEKNNS